MEAKNVTEEEARLALRTHSFRITTARVKLLLLLRRIGKPLSIQDILSHWSDAPNQATVYRMLTDLSDAGIIKRVATQSGTAHFEYTPDYPHHHHAICTDCGTIEDIQHCFVDSIQKQVIKDLETFSSIDSHSLEFFGRCNKCKI
ncbi:MAG: zinc-specific metallo-regulatory protein [Candidatus Parcubacteria bacterium]|jgi:Fur family ferric uptake transcriptional regulator